LAFDPPTRIETKDAVLIPKHHHETHQSREAANVMDRLVTPILVEIPKAENSISKTNCTQIAQKQ
jgi:hypothetical protein